MLLLFQGSARAGAEEAAARCLREAADAKSGADGMVPGAAERAEQDAEAAELIRCAAFASLLRSLFWTCCAWLQQHMRPG